MKLLLKIYFGLTLLFCGGIGEFSFANTKELYSVSELLIKYRTYYDTFYKIENPSQRYLYADSALIIAVKLDDKERVARAMLLKALTHRVRGDFFKAMDCAQEGLFIYDKLNDSKGIAASYLETGNIYYQSKEKRKAEEWYKKALNAFKYINDSLRCAAVNLNLGECKRDWDEPDSAIYFNKRASKLFQKAKYSQGVAYAKGNMGLAFIDLIELDSAKKYLDEGVKLLEPYKDNYAISSYKEGLARIYLEEKHYSDAINAVISSFLLAKEHGLKEQMRDASLTLANIYNAQKQYDKAYQKHCEYVAYRDSINNEETVRKIANLRTKYEVAQKQKEVDDLVNQKERYTIIGISLFVVLFLLLAHVAHLYRNRRLRKHDAIILAKQHKELEIANDTKNKFFSILSHDLRSPIATFNSYSEVLNYYLETNDYEQIPELAKELERSSASVVQLLDNLLQWGVIQMKNIKINKVNVPILQVFQEELIHIQPIANSKDIQIQSNIASDLDLHVDKPFFAMTMRNLISNSLKFTKVGGFITVSAYREKDHIIVKVADTGIGLEVADFKKRLCSGDIASTYGTNNEKGLGLGLQLVCSFIESHGAEIDVESIIGKGTTFILKFKNTILS
ncbi:tetratricopeptide repeat-containing sensor histidine kinase [Saccharicrinis aurantiacus]|uniref:tetratricopeptide repeat-containing sensor histidine kinase n=1 Tax=Saccharicrinis aurantiacus TaxID=1849719 RepID=UPI00094F7943|nr:HAMP domain-containing sensor histidine kinase [Saccharicrinis aurantiacus]